MSAVAGDGTVLEEFMTSSFTEWRKEKTDEGVEYLKDGVPQPEQAYNAAKQSALPGSDFTDPYSVTDYSAEEIDEFAERPDDLEPEELRALKDVRAAYTVQHAAETTPFYREWFDKHGIDPYEVEGIDDLREIPIVTGDHILENQPPQTDDYRFRNPDADHRRLLHTTGSTGTPKERFASYYDMDRVEEDLIRGFEHFDITEDSRVVNYFPFVGLNISGPSTENSLQKMGAETIPVSNTPYPVEVEANILRSHQPSAEEREDGKNYVMIGLSSHIDSRGRRFQELAEENGEEYNPASFGIDVIAVAGEPTSESRKENIADIYDADVYEFLGSTEMGAPAWECKDRTGLHLVDDSVHIDIVDDRGRQMPEGETGHLVSTFLLHPGEESSMPIIRYDPGDDAAYLGEPECNCGIGSDGLMSAPRRDSWTFSLGGVTLDPTYFEEGIYDHPVLSDVADEYQVHPYYDEEKGQDVLEVLIKTMDDEYVGQTSQVVKRGDTAENVADELVQDFLEGDSHLNDTVGIGGARIEVELVSELDVGPKKPQRLIED